jgi:hypothetical protein
MRLLRLTLEKPLALELIPGSNVSVPRQVLTGSGRVPRAADSQVCGASRASPTLRAAAAARNGFVPRRNGFVPKKTTSVRQVSAIGVGYAPRNTPKAGALR